jgi:hypothetical protein
MNPLSDGLGDASGDSVVARMLLIIIHSVVAALAEGDESSENDADGRGRQAKDYWSSGWGQTLAGESSGHSHPYVTSPNSPSSPMNMSREGEGKVTTK